MSEQDVRVRIPPGARKHNRLTILQIGGIESIEVAEDGAAKVTFNTPATYTS